MAWPHPGGAGSGFITGELGFELLDLGQHVSQREELPAAARAQPTTAKEVSRWRHQQPTTTVSRRAAQLTDDTEAQGHTVICCNLSLAVT